MLLLVTLYCLFVVYILTFGLVNKCIVKQLVTSKQLKKSDCLLFMVYKSSGV